MTEASGRLCGAVALTTAVGSWYACSVAFNITMKQAFKALPDVLALTSLQFMCGALVAALAAMIGLLPLPTRELYTSRILPSAALLVGGTLCTNISLTLLSVSFTHLVKTCEPLMTTWLMLLWHGERPGTAPLLSLAVIIIGVYISSSMELKFRLNGFVAGMLANLLLQMRNILNKDAIAVLRQPHHYGAQSEGEPPRKRSASAAAMALLLHSLALGLPMQLAVHLAVVLAQRTPTQLEPPFALLRPLLAAGSTLKQLLPPITFVSYQGFSILVLSRVHPVMHAILNTLKRGVVIGFGAIWLKEALSSSWVLGMAFALSGVLSFSLNKRIESPFSRQRLVVALTLLLAVASTTAASMPGEAAEPPHEAPALQHPRLRGRGGGALSGRGGGGGGRGRTWKSRFEREWELSPWARSNVSSVREPKRYAVLSFSTMCRIQKFRNIGDTIQSLVGMQFLPRVDDYIDRDGDDLMRPQPAPTALFFNNWWNRARDADFVPHRNIVPMVFGIHASGDFIDALYRPGGKLKGWFAKHAPVGARDLDTLRMMQELKIPSYFSGCPTSMFKRPSQVVDESHREYSRKFGPTFIIDVAEEDIALIPESIRNSAHRVDMTQVFRDRRGCRHYQVPTFDIHEAHMRLVQYAMAKLIITTRLHVASPAIAMGTPVVFINKNLQGGFPTRLQGMLDFFHTSDDADRFPSWYDVPVVKNLHKWHRMRTTLWGAIATQWPAIAQHSREMNVVPQVSSNMPALTRDAKRARKSAPTFHFVLWQDKAHGAQGWRVAKAIESVLFHYPEAKVLVHTLGQLQLPLSLSVLQEVGYRVQARRFDVATKLPAALRNSPEAQALAAALSSQRQKLASDPNSHAHLAALAGAVALYEYGGVLLDDDTLLLRTLEHLGPTFMLAPAVTPSGVLPTLGANEKGKGARVLLKQLVATYGGALAAGKALPSLKEAAAAARSAAVEEAFKAVPENGLEAQLPLQPQACFVGGAYNASDAASALEGGPNVLRMHTAESGKLPLRVGGLCHHMLAKLCVLCHEVASHSSYA